MSQQSDDWRLRNQENYLRGVTLHWSMWTETRPGWDHDHCAFCFAEIADSRHPKAMHEGYTDAEDYHWICMTCFDDFKELFDWRLDDDGPSATRTS